MALPRCGYPRNPAALPALPVLLRRAPCPDTRDRPSVSDSHKIPDILFSGNHQAIAEWRFKQSYLKTLQNRPDLLKEKQFSQKEHQLIQELEDDSKQQIAIEKAKKFMK